jgi:iron(III) transport system ATP-binding protein
MGMTEQASKPGLDVREISHAFGAKTVVDGVTLDVAPGEILCLLGPSGCGKTTTLRLIAGLERLQTGSIAINGELVAGEGVDMPPEKRGVSLLFQDFALFPHLTVTQNVTFGLGHLSRDQRKARAEEVLEQVGMLGLAGRYPHELSGGEQQRVALARARAPRPRVMLLDEPFSNLDVRLRGQVRDIVLHVLRKSVASTLMVTHDPEEAMFMADKIAVMSAGRILQVDTPARLYSAPADGFVAGLFSELNRVTGTVRQGHVETPVGRLCTPHLGEGLNVDVLIRPEAVRLGAAEAAADGPGVRGRVMAARMLGRSSLVHLSVEAENGAEIHLHARMAGRHCPGDNEIVGISIDHDQVFVFPADGPT